MSQDSVALFQRWTAAVGRGDVDYIVRHSTTDVMFIAARSAIEGPFVGHEGLRRFVAENATDFEVIAGRYDDVRDLGDDRVLAIGTIHFRGRAGGVDTHVPSAPIATFRERKLSRWEDFRERNAALKAVGLEE